MIGITRLFDLFGEFSDLLPRQLIQAETGVSATPDPPAVAAWLGQLNNGSSLTDIRTGTLGNRASVAAKVAFSNLAAGFTAPNGWPFVLQAMPDVEFRLQDGDKITLFASITDRGAELLIENLPVEIRLPAGLIQPPETEAGGVPGSDEISRSGSDLKIIYRRDGPTAITTNIRLHITEDNEVSIQTHAPISFEKCLFSGIPCKAIHDFMLIPSPGIAQRTVHWLRHSILPFLDTPPVEGMFAIRSIHMDSTEGVFKDMAEFLNRKADTIPQAEFVLDDLVLPFYSVYVLPIPRHVTLGIRKLLLEPDQVANPREIFAFDSAPVQAFFSRDPMVSLIVKSLFYKSMPADALDQDLGLTFSAGIVFTSNAGPAEGEPDIDEHAILFGLGENYTLFAGYQRGFDETTETPAEGEGAERVIHSIVQLTIAGFTLHLMGFRLGYSIGRHLELDRKGSDTGDTIVNSMEITADFIISRKKGGDEEAGEGSAAADSSNDDALSIRSISGEELKYILVEGIGWRQGSFALMEKVSIPDGMVITFKDTVGLIIEELGWLSEQGANYFSISGGILIKVPSGAEGGMVFRRLRFRVAGNPGAPPFKLDGFFLFLRFPTVGIEAGGYYTEKEVGDALIKEFGLTGKVTFELSAVEYIIGLDLIAGKLESPAESFDYLMMQLFFRGSITIAWFELRGVRLLFARNMQPKLGSVDKDSHESRYYKWYKRNNPVEVPGDRRLAAWQPQNEAWALGIGLSASIASLGSVAELTVFVLVIDGPDENGLLVVGELFLLQSKKPAGYFALEWDGKNDRFSLLIGVDLKLSNFMDDPPEWSENILKISGTLFISNDPGTVAIGRLADERTWFALQFDLDFWIFRSFIRFGFCFEYVDDGPTGFGLFIRLQGGLDVGVLQITYNVGFGLLIVAFTTGSSDYAAAFWIEGGLRITLFRFIRFGISAGVEFRNVGRSPSRGELKAKFKFETPWFLPDVTWTLEKVFGDLEPDRLSTSVAPLRVANAVSIRRDTLAVHIERFDNSWSGTDQAPLHKVADLRRPAAAEADRLSRFAANTQLRPIPIDATIEIEWTVAVNDQLYLDTNIPVGRGRQEAGDLTLVYDFVRIAIRRRPRFGSSRPWQNIETRQSIDIDPTALDSSAVSGFFDPSIVSKTWDPDVRIGGQPAAKKLRINAKTPYEFTSRHPEADEELVATNPGYPCCQRDGKQPEYPVHELSYRAEPIGIDLQGEARTFTHSHSVWIFQPQSLVRLPALGALPPPGGPVALGIRRSPGLISRATFDADVATVILRLAWQTGRGRLRIALYDATGEQLKYIDLEKARSEGFETLTVNAPFGIRSLEIHYLSRLDEVDETFTVHTGSTAIVIQSKVALLEVDQVKYVTLRDYRQGILQWVRCVGGKGGGMDAFTGQGKLSFLPNHEYEIAITTRISIDHPSQSAEPAEVEEFVYFKTKGLPGLNAVERIGEEVEPYVAAAYAGGAGRVYREEPVALAFTEDFHVAVPLAVRPAGSVEEYQTLLQLQLLVRPNVALDAATPFTQTTDDWIVANRRIIIPVKYHHWQPLLTLAFDQPNPARSTDPRLARLATITQRPAVSCDYADPRDVSGTVLIAPPQGTVDPRSEDGAQLWPAATAFTATLRRRGAAFVDRQGFEPQDLTAFDYFTDTGPAAAGQWTQEDGHIAVSTGAGRRYAAFGANDWNHVQIDLQLSISSGRAGIGVALPTGAAPSVGLFASLRRAGEESYMLEIHRSRSGTVFQLLQSVAIPTAGLDASRPTLQLQVTAFDDRLRARVGEVQIEVDRDELREGRLALLAEGQVTFHTLQVEGIALYTYPFTSSRFLSFAQHIQSFSGTIDRLSGDTMGAAAVAAPVGTLVSDTRSLIQAAATAPERQALFERWQEALHIPLKDELERLELSRYEAGGQTAFLLLESPEPLDFAKEVSLALARRVAVRPPGGGRPPIFDPTLVRPGRLGGVLSPGGRPRSLEAPTASLEQALHALRHQPDRIEHFGENRPLELTDLQRNLRDPSSPGTLIEVELARDGKSLTAQVEVAHALLSRKQLADWRFIAKLSSGIRFYRITAAKVIDRTHLQLSAQAVKQQPLTPALQKAINARLDDAAIGSVLLLDIRAGLFFDLPGPSFTYQPVDLLILSNGDRSRSLLIPVSSSDHQPLVSGRYRFQFHLERERWPTTAAMDEWNHYRGEASLFVDI